MKKSKLVRISEYGMYLSSYSLGKCGESGTAVVGKFVVGPNLSVVLIHK